MINFKPQKGKAFDALPNKTLETFNNTKYIVSTKYDGNQIFVVKKGSSIRCFTSNWKEFSNYYITEPLKNIKDDFTLMGEFMFNSEGKLGDRINSAILTTLRTNFSKSIPNNNNDIVQTNVKFFDIISERLIDEPYIYRLSYLQTLLNDNKVVPQLSAITGVVMYGKDAIEYTKKLVNQGYEGCMLVEVTSLYNIGKRVNHSIKLKYRKTADLLCIGCTDGEGKYYGKIGSLILQDSLGRTVNVGSGLNDIDRNKPTTDFIDKVIEISYEQIIDTYIQPTFVTIRLDKAAEYID